VHALPLAASTDITVTTGTNILYGDNGAGKTLLARCIAGQIHVNSWLTNVLAAAFGDLFGLLSGLYGRGTLTNVLPSRLAHDPESPAVTFRQYRNMGYTAFRPSEPSMFLSEVSVESELRRFVPASEIEMRIEYLHRHGIRPSDTVSELSFGQRKLVGFATISDTARLVVLDEPLAGLSYDSRQRLVRFLGDMHESSQITHKSFVITTTRLSDQNLFAAKVLE
jgi:ABC-type multidrug transport system ATPase subunit